MTCCLLLRLFVGGWFRGKRPRLLAMRLGRHWRGWIIAIAAVELAAAWLLVRTLIYLNDPASPAMAMPVMSATATDRSPAAASLALGLLGGALIVGIVALRTRSGRFAVYTSLAGFGVALLPVVRAAATQSHLILMAQLMVLMVVAPALLMTALTRGAARGPGWALVASGGYLAILYVWHLPATHEAVSENPGWAWVRVASWVAFGLVFWALARTNLVAVLITGAGSGLLGLALVLGQQPLFAMRANPLGLSGLADQRLAGLLMMAIDLLVVLPIAGRLADRPDLAGATESNPSDTPVFVPFGA